MAHDMFLVEYPRFGGSDLVFTWIDPRKGEYVGDVIEEVSLDYDMAAVHAWPDGEPAPDVCVGRSPDDPKHYKVFRSKSECLAEGYERVAGTPFMFGPWSDYMRLHLSPPHPDRVDEEDWYNYLDKVDEVARLWRNGHNEALMPKSGDRDEVAAWVAKSHFVVDSSIREVWYLPKGAPQMATELLGKAHAWRQGPRAHTHVAFVGFLRGLVSNRDAQRLLGFKGMNANWRTMIQKCVPMAEKVELLAPSLSLDGPNPEYPLPRAAPQFAPVEHTFEVWRDLQEPAGKRFLNLAGNLFAAAEAFL